MQIKVHNKMFENEQNIADNDWKQTHKLGRNVEKRTVKSYNQTIN